MRFFKALLCAVSFIGACSCSNPLEEDEYIILVKGISMDPDEPRKAVELNPKELFYCTELVKGPKWEASDYEYFHSTVESSTFVFFKEAMLKEFMVDFPLDSAYDDTKYQLIYKLGNDRDTLTFYTSSLGGAKYDLVDSLFQLGSTDMTPVRYHDFPESLLYEVLPVPPTPQELELLGKWYYTDSQNSHAEFWFDPNIALHIDEGSYYLEFYRYAVTQDSLRLMHFESGHKITSLAIKRHENGRLELENAFIQMQMIRFGDTVSIDTSKSFVDQFYAGFKERL